MVAVGAQRFEAFLMGACDAQFVHEAQGPVSTTIAAFILQVVINRAVSITPFGLLVQDFNTLLQGGSSQARAARLTTQPGIITAAAQPKAIAQLLNREAITVFFYEAILH